jgi:hypothetical protein
LKENLRVAQSQQKMYGDRYRMEGTFEEVVSKESPHWDDEGRWVKDTRYIKYAEQKRNARNDRITVKYPA